MQFTIIYSPEEHWVIAKALSVAAAVTQKEGDEAKAKELTILATRIETLLWAQDEVAGKKMSQPPAAPPQKPSP